MALMMVLGLMFTSCKEDTQPRLEKPTEFHLNTPPMAESEYIMSRTSILNLTVSQPNYGVGLVTSYQVQLAKTADFDTFEPIETVYNDANINVTGEDFCLALCNLFEYDSEDNFSDEVRPIFVRVKAYIPGVEYSEILSNVVELKQVRPYFAIKLADMIYIVGEPNGWGIGDESMPLVETEPESRIYTGIYEIEAGKFKFRFYDVLGDWEHYSIGSQDDDASIEITFTDGVYEGACFYDPATEKAGKGSWEVPGWSGGKVKMTVDLSKTSDMKVVFEIVE